MNYLAVVKRAHRTLTIWYGYFVGGVLVIQASWDQLDDYIPPKWRKIALGVVTAIVIIDKIRRSARDESAAR